MLIDKKTRKEIKIGDTVETHRGKSAVVTDIADLVYIKSDLATKPYGVNMEAIGAEWVDDKIESVLNVDNERKRMLLLNALSVRGEYLRNRRYTMVRGDLDVTDIDADIVAVAEMYADVDRMG